MKLPRLFIAILAALQLLSACHKETEQDRIKKLVASVQKAAENKDIKEILSRVAKDYRDPQGNDYAAIKDILLYYVFKHQALSVIITNLDVTVSGESAA